MKQTLILLLSSLTLILTPATRRDPRPWQGKPQVIPGKLEFEFYDEGGEGIAYHDKDSVNNGSGKLNPANGEWLNEFRKTGAVDISYTKPGGIDDNPYNKITPVMHSLYVGWTEPGEWINYTVLVKETGTYQADLRYTSHEGGRVAFDLDGKPYADSLFIPSTYDARDTTAWRQWHHWNELPAFCTFKFSSGIHNIRFRIVDKGNMNFDYLVFTKKAAPENNTAPTGKEN